MSAGWTGIGFILDYEEREKDDVAFIINVPGGVVDIHALRVAAAAPDLLAALRKSKEGWANAIELGLIPARHIKSAEILRDEADAAIAKATTQSEVG